MYLVYLDESGYTGKNLDDKDQPVHVMAAVFIHSPVWQPLQTHLLNCCAPIRAKYPIIKNFEIHATDIYRGNTPFKWKTADRFELLDKALECFTSHDLSIVYGAVDKRSLKAKYAYPFAPHDLAFMLCVERVERWLKVHGNGEPALLICDETKVKLDLKKSLKKFQYVGTPIGRCEIMDHIIDTIHFADSHESYGIQLADCANYFIKRRIEGKKNTQRFYDQIKGKIWDGRVFP